MDSRDILLVLFIILIVLTALVIIQFKIIEGPVVKSGANDDVHLEPISKSNITAVKEISVAKNQQKYVATIADSLIQASFLKNWKGYALKDGDNFVGFGSIADYEKIPNATKIYKMIIDKNQQGKGYGKKLLDLLINVAPDSNIYIDLHSDNTIAKNLYLKRFDIISDDGNTIIMKLKNQDKRT